MLLRDEDIGAFRKWLLPKLEKVSDADVEVLADYVVALVTANETEGSLKENCLESLADFLQDNTTAFVNDLVEAVNTKPYISRAQAKGKANGTKPQSTNEQQRDASQPGPISSIVGTSTSEYAPNPSRAARTPPSHAPKGPAATRAKASHRLPDRPDAPSPARRSSAADNTQQSSRKRKQAQRDVSEARDGQDSHYSSVGAGQRSMKQATRRGGNNALRAGAATFQPQNAVPGFAPMPNLPTPNMLNLANLPPPPPGPMPFDMMNNPMAFLTMMAALGTNMPGMPSLPQINAQGKGTNGQTRQGKCLDYHENGFCARGNMCAFQHDGGHDAVNDAPEYDPEEPSLGTPFGTVINKRPGPKRTNNIGGKGGKSRAPFSAPGPSHDRTNTTLVVEQIPEEHFNEENVRGFFSEFGTIVDVELQVYKRLAIVKFEDHATANRAYMSPKDVFENRFVKVYWYKENSSTEAARYGNVEMADGSNTYGDDEEALDLEGIARRQDEAQKAFEERRRKWDEAEARSADIDRQLKEKDAEMKEIRKQLAELAGEDIDGLNEEYSQELATLAAEAETLFAQKEPLPPGGRGRGFPPSGAYRGRGLAPFFRGRGAPRGGYLGRGRGRSRGTFSPFPNNRSSVKRLDNRPRRLAIAGIQKGTSREEALRQYLLNMPECTNIEPHPEEPDTLILTFEQRYQAETFLDNSRQIPDTGPLELSWVPNDAFGGLPASTTTKETDADANANTGLDVDASDDNSSATAEENVKVEADEDDRAADLDMDVADDVDQWL